MPNPLPEPYVKAPLTMYVRQVAILRREAQRRGMQTSPFFRMLMDEWVRWLEKNSFDSTERMDKVWVSTNPPIPEPFMFQVQTGVPMPKTIRTVPANQRKYPFDTMPVGGMFFVPNKTKNTLATHASMIGKKLGRKFTTRLVKMVDTEEGWQLAQPGDEDAELGIGVWRTE